jgi:hypothetical protein
MAANDTARRLRAGEATMLDDLECALRAARTLGEAAELIGLAGASSLWRIAANTPHVRDLIRRHSHGRGRPKGTTA